MARTNIQKNIRSKVNATTCHSSLISRVSFVMSFSLNDFAMSIRLFSIQRSWPSSVIRCECSILTKNASVLPPNECLVMYASDAGRPFDLGWSRSSRVMSSTPRWRLEAASVFWFSASRFRIFDVVVVPNERSVQNALAKQPREIWNDKVYLVGRYAFF